MISYLAVGLLLFDIINTLHWSTSRYKSDSDNLILLQYTSNEGPKIDVSSNDQVIIVKDLSNYDKKITIFCFIAGYHDNSRISYNFCKQHDRDCSSPFEDGEEKDVYFHGMKMSIKTNFPNQKGLRIEITLPPDQKDASGNFFCKAKDDEGHFTIQSNYIQIRDRIFWEQYSVLNRDNLKTIHQSVVGRQNLPITFPCIKSGLKMDQNLPEWFYQEFSSPVLWVVCPVMNNYKNLQANQKVTFDNCIKYTLSKWPEGRDESIKPIDISVFTKSYVNNKGELIIFDFKKDFKPSELSYALMCYTMKKDSVNPINTIFKESNGHDIVSGVVFDVSFPTQSSPLKPISPILQQVDIYSRTVPKSIKLKNVGIYVEYQSSMESKGTWYHNGNLLSDGDNQISDKFQVLFQRDIKSEMGGNYTVVVTDKSEKLTMTIMVTVKGPPVLINKNCLPIVKYVWENDSVSFQCHYTNQPEELKLQINNQEFKLDRSYNSLNTDLRHTYKHLSDLNATITPTNYLPSNNVTMTYTVYNLQKSQGQIKYQDHSITFFVKNSYGLSVRSTSIYTVPRVKEKITSFPDSYNCITNCLSIEKHDFQCRFNRDEYKNKELKVDHYWTINSHRLEQINKSDNWFAPYFRVDHQTKDLVLLPMNNNKSTKNDFVRKSLKSNYIICNIDLFPTTETRTGFGYQSISDSLINYRLKSQIMLDPNSTNTALICGIIAALLVLLVIVIIIVIIYQRMRSSGETYQLEKLEVKHGINRDKEVEEEKFQPYQNDGDHLEKISNESENIDNPYQQEDSRLVN